MKLDGLTGRFSSVDYVCWLSLTKRQVTGIIMISQGGDLQILLSYPRIQEVTKKTAPKGRKGLRLPPPVFWISLNIYRRQGGCQV